MTTEPQLNAAQLQLAEQKAREMFKQWVDAANLRKWAAELVYRDRHVAEPITEASKLYEFVTGNQQ